MTSTESSSLNNNLNHDHHPPSSASDPDPDIANPTTTTTTDTTEATMSVFPARASTLLSNLQTVTSRIAAASAKSTARKPVRLVAVSKLKPASDILALHSAPPPTGPQLHFGENYVQELLEKSRILPPTIKWHFIGGLQSGKCVSLARDVRGLWAVESVDTEQKARFLNKGWGRRKESRRKAGLEDRDEKEGEYEKLRIFVQVNTSGEENKSGCDPRSTPSLCRYVRENCPWLHIQGLMTIGAIARSQATSPENENEDFAILRETREMVVHELGLKDEEAAAFELSMGMSADFEGAIVQGSDEVRVGTTIFGRRPPKSQAKVL
jgi:pyridoxal phosphate enzyme (YggS family)